MLVIVLFKFLCFSYLLHNKSITNTKLKKNIAVLSYLQSHRNSDRADKRDKKASETGSRLMSNRAGKAF
jgi:hypothetical protein